MKKIMFNDKLLLTKSVLEGTKKRTFRLNDNYSVGETVAIAQSYKDCGLPVTIRYGIGIRLLWQEPGYHNKMFVQSDLMVNHIEITDRKRCRIQDVTDEECMMEGIVKVGDSYSFGDMKEMFDLPIFAFKRMVEKTMGYEIWMSNCVGYAYEFKLKKETV